MDWNTEMRYKPNVAIVLIVYKYICSIIMEEIIKIKIKE